MSKWDWILMYVKLSLTSYKFIQWVEGESQLLKLKPKPSWMFNCFKSQFNLNLKSKTFFHSKATIWLLMLINSVGWKQIWFPLDLIEYPLSIQGIKNDMQVVKGLKTYSKHISRFSGKFFTFSWLNRSCFQIQIEQLPFSKLSLLLKSWFIASRKSSENVFAINNLVRRRMKLISHCRCRCRPSFRHTSGWDLNSTDIKTWRLERCDNSDFKERLIKNVFTTNSPCDRRLSEISDTDSYCSTQLTKITNKRDKLSINERMNT